MKSLKLRLKLMNKILFISIFALLSLNSAFAISVSTSTTFQPNCPWANVNETIYITGSTQKIYPTDLMRSNENLLFIRNEESNVSIWQNKVDTLTTGCFKELDSTNTWWGRLSNVVPWTNQYVWIFKDFWNICDANKVKRTNILRPSVQFVYKVAYKEELSKATWIKSYYYYPYTSWVLSPIQTFIPDQTTRNWGTIKYHPDECHNFTFAFCWDWIQDLSHSESCDDGNNINWDGCSATCKKETVSTCNSLIANPNSWNTPLTSTFTCSASNASSYRINIYSGSTIINTINTRTWSYTFTNTWSYTARCTINWNITSNACLAWITVWWIITPTPDIQIDKRDANPADLDWVIWNDTQTVRVSSWAIFRIRATNNYTESLRNIVFTDLASPNCSWSVTLPSTFPSTWTGVTVGWSWNHTNATLEVWEYIDYVCDRSNTTAWYTNSATVTWVWITSNQTVTDTDTTVVLISTISWPTCWTAWGYVFPYSTTTWGTLTFCSSWAIPNPNPPVFPSQWWSTSWTCNWSWSTVNCNASRLSPGGWWGGGWWWWGWPSCTRISIPALEATWNWKAMSSTWSVAISCYWNSRAMVIWIDCDLDWNGATKSITYQSNSIIGWGWRVSNFTCTYNNLNIVPHPKCYVTTWGWTVTTNSTSSLACSTWLSVWNTYCWDWVIQRPNDNHQNEVCEKSINATTWILEFPFWCTNNCQTLNFTYPWQWQGILTFPGNGNIIFRPFWNVIIWAWSNPFTYTTQPFISNNSSEDLYLDYPLCVHSSNASVLLRPSWVWLTRVCTSNKIWWMYPGVTKTYESLNWWNPVKVSWMRITGSENYRDTILKITLWDFKDAFFAAVFNVRVSKPAVATVWWWTSLIRNSNITADINKVADWYMDESNKNKNKNFVWAWVSTGSISSYTKNVSNTNSVTKISSWQTSKTETNITKVSTTQVTWNKTINQTLTKYNGLSNVFIVKNWNLTIDSSIPWSWEKTYIVEWWNLYINQNITYSDNIAFVVKWWNIIIASSVTKINGTFISIKVSGIWWEIISQESDYKLIINWSLYGDIEKLVNNRTHIENKNDLINVWTIVSFGSNLFRKQAPLVWDFIWEYIASKKVAK